MFGMVIGPGKWRLCDSWVSWRDHAAYEENANGNRTKRIDYLVENAKAANVVLTNNEIKEIRDFVDAAEVQGERAPEL